MDWLDHYLDGLAEGTNVVYPPDSNTWRPVKPTKQQQSFIQDSIIADMVRMRMIQEERAKLENHGGGFYDGAISTNILTPTPTLPSYLLFEDGSFAMAENNDNIEINIT
jgi:hypothetical protein